MWIQDEKYWTLYVKVRHFEDISNLPNILPDGILKVFTAHCTLAPSQWCMIELLYYVCFLPCIAFTGLNCYGGQQNLRLWKANCLKSFNHKKGFLPFRALPTIGNELEWLLIGLNCQVWHTYYGLVQYNNLVILIDWDAANKKFDYSVKSINWVTRYCTGKIRHWEMTQKYLLESPIWNSGKHVYKGHPPSLTIMSLRAYQRVALTLLI